MGFCGICSWPLQLDRAAHGARRAARPRDEPAHARLRRQHAVRRVPHRLGGRGGGRDDGPARGRGGGWCRCWRCCCGEWSRPRPSLAPRARRKDPHEARRPRGAPQRRDARPRRDVGWNYTEWKGSFYPGDMKPAAMLPYYAARFGTVEVNATFYRMPTPKVVAAGRRRRRPISRSCSRRRSGSPTSRDSATWTNPSASSATSRAGSARASAPALPAAAELQEGRRAPRDVLYMVPPELRMAWSSGTSLVRRRRLRPAARAQRGAGHRRRRGQDHATLPPRLGVFPASRGDYTDGAARGLAEDHSQRRRRLARRLRLLQARGARDRARARAAARNSARDLILCSPTSLGRQPPALRRSVMLIW